MKTIKFYKDDSGWYATVEGHTKAQNKMILGADVFLEMVDDITNRDGEVIVECDDKDVEKPMITLKRKVHIPFGAYYRVSGSYAKKHLLNKGTVFLCNVVHTVFGEHPKNIYISTIN